MHEDEVHASEDMSLTLEGVHEQPERKKYTVVNPLFKHGKQYRRGAKIELDEVTANNFKNTGDIK